MINGFFKFPTTPHLLWLGKVAARSDKVMSKSEAEAFLRSSVTIEEKVDGANLGISFDAQGNLRAQNRGNYLAHEERGQFLPLWNWLRKRESCLLNALEDKLILFGEWCFARHSIHYTQLPDYFLAFDVFDKEKRSFFSSYRRDQMVSALDLSLVPRVTSGHFALNELPSLIGESRLYQGSMEGIYLRQDDEQWLCRRAKVVRAEFAQRIEKHWSKSQLVPNHLLCEDVLSRGQS